MMEWHILYKSSALPVMVDGFMNEIKEVANFDEEKSIVEYDETNIKQVNDIERIFAKYKDLIVLDNRSNVQCRELL